MQNIKRDQAEALSLRLSRLPEDKKRIFRNKLKAEGIDAWQLPIIAEFMPPTFRQLSYSQRRLWFIDEMEGGRSLYNIAFALTINGDLDYPLLNHSVNDIINRHQVLRTNVVNVDGEGRQTVRDYSPLAFNYLDLPKLDDPEDTALQKIINKEAMTPFDLENAPHMMRFTLVKRSGENTEKQHVAVLSFHHIAFDAFSVGLFVEELQQGYVHYQNHGTADRSQAENLDKHIRLQYADYASWHSQWLDSEAAQAEEAYWRCQLADAPAQTRVPGCYRHPEKMTYEGRQKLIQLSPELSGRIEHMIKREGVTFYMIMLAALNVLLSRQSGQNDILVGTSIANRSRIETVRLLGVFVNTLVMRNKLASNQTFKQFLGSVKKNATDAYANQELPFDKVVDLLGLERRNNISPLFQVLFVVNNALDSVSLDLNGVEVAPYQLESQTARFDLTLRVSQETPLSTAPGISCALEYNVALYSGRRITELLAQYEYLLTQISENIDCPLDSLQLLNPAQQRAVSLTGKTDTARFNLTGLNNIHEALEQTAETHPEKVALIFTSEVSRVGLSGSESLSYAELNGQANQLARKLMALGVQPQQHVGFFLERTADCIVALFAILKAGCAYVPLDTSWPIGRLAVIAADANLQFILTDKHSVSLFDAVESAALDLRCDLSAFDAGNPGLAIEDKHCAYLIYTSGSSGTPKGVVVEHKQVLAYVSGLLDELDIAGLHFASVSSVATDLGNTAIYGALCSGGVLNLVADGFLRDADEFAAYMSANSVEVLKITPTFLEGLLAAATEARTVLPKHTLILGGERCPKRLSEQVTGLNPLCRVVNHYGPTETTVGALTYCYAANSDLPGETLPIGKPLPGYSAVVVDQYYQPCPVGVPGELVIGGLGVSRGYYGHDALTKEKFFRDSQGKRCYKTGDVARLLENNSIEFLGRTDDQVKIRGYRVELADIETCLALNTAVSTARVRIINEADKKSTLIAYVLLETGHSPSRKIESDLEQQLQENLPEYMIPTRLFMLDKFPLTINGKVDVRALENMAIQDTRESNGLSLKLPETDIERTLMEIWQALLKKADFGIDDNFFELGGDSILSLQVIARAKRAGYKLLPKQLFEHQTISGLAAVATLLENKKSGAHVDKIVTGEVLTTPIQQWFLRAQHEKSHHWNQSVILQAKETLEPEALALAVSYIVRHHDQLRCEFVPEDGNDRQVILDWDLEKGKKYYVEEPRSSSPFYARANNWQGRLSFKAENGIGQLFKVVHFVGDSSSADRLLLVAHHLLVDGISWRILSEDLLIAYRHAKKIVSGVENKAPKNVYENTLPELPGKTLSFQAWSKVLSAAAAQEEKISWQRAARHYWGEMAGQISPGKDMLMPAEPVAKLSDVVTLQVTLSQSETRALLQDAPRAYKTQINDLLLSAMAIAVARQSASQNLYLELEGHGRENVYDSTEDIDLSRTIGWFTSRFPVLLRASVSDIGALICSTKEQLRALPAKGMSYGVMVFSHKMTPLPKPAISFNYLGQIDATQDVLSQTFEAVSEKGALVERHPDNKVTHGLSVNAIVVGGALRLSFQYVSDLIKIDIPQLADDYLEACRGVIEHCGTETKGFTPSDFPLVAATQKQIDSISAAVGLAQVEDIYGLTPLQEGMLFHTLVDSESQHQKTAYFNQLLVDLKGEFDPKLFSVAWHAVIARHSILRSSFWVDSGSEPVQLVHRECTMPIARQDLKALDPTDRIKTISRYCLADRESGFDLQQAPLMRLTLFELGDAHWQVLWSRHHLLLDGWSSTRMLQEVMGSYQSLRKGEDLKDNPILANRPAPFSRYIEWLHNQESEKPRQFWTNYLDGVHAPPTIGLKRIATESHSHTFRLSKELTEGLHALSGRTKVTLNTVMQAAWGLVLSRFIGGDKDAQEVIFGMTSAGRSMDIDTIDEMLGLFINTLPLRIRLDLNQPLEKFLRELQLNQASVREHEYVSLSQIQTWSAISNGQSLFESLFIFENYMVNDRALQQLQDDEDKLQLTTVNNHETTNYPLTLVVIPSAQQIEIRFSSNGMHTADLDRIAECYQSALQSMNDAHGDVPIGKLEVLPASQKRQLLSEWNSTCREVAEQSIEVLFSAKARERGEATAVCFRDSEKHYESMSYAELERKSNQLAREILARGVTPNQLVGVAVQRSLSLLVSVLAVLKSGAAYVPLDPYYPQDRLRYMTDDADLKILLCDQWIDRKKILQTDNPCPVIKVDLENFSHYDPTVPSHSAGLNDTAYVIYTSGSTGKPKGVQITRGNLANFILGMQDLFKLSNADRMLAVTSLSFDIAGLELYLPLVSGAAVVMGDRGLSTDGSRLKEAIEEGITIMQATPVSWKLLLAAQWKHDQSQNEPFTALCGGENFPVELARELVDQDITVWNMYGPTETTIWSSAYRLAQNKADICTTVPVGRPIVNTQLYVLDRNLRPVPLGVTGELYIGGAGVARGYLNRRDLSEERFLDTEYGRLYQTGDLARYRENGVLECLGRLDNQVKIRGFRIELGEIEQVLMQCEELLDVAVQPLVRTGEPVLVAYIVCTPALTAENTSKLTEKLRKMLANKLPVYMVPAMFLVLDALPLTPNGKVDRKALPNPDFSGERDNYQQPATELQTRLCGIWQEVLGVERVGINDNFFALGGHSLLAIRMKMRLSNDLGIELSIAQMLSNQTVELLSTVIEQQQAKIGEDDLNWMDDLMSDLEN